MTENKETSLWFRFLNAYGKHLNLLIFCLILTLAVISTLAYRVDAYRLGTPSMLIFSSAFLLLSLLTMKLAKKEMHAYRLFQTEKLTYRLNFVLMLIILLSFFFSSIQSVYFSGVTIEMQHESFLWIFIFSVVMWIFNYLNMSTFMFMPSFTRAKLCFIVTIDSLKTLHAQKKVDRYKSIGKYFMFFNKGLSHSNRHLGKKLPDHPKIIDIKSYYDYAYLIALEGNEQELNTLRANIVEVDKSLRENNFRHLLIALKRLKGKTSSDYTSITELSKLFRTVPPSIRFIESLKRMTPLFTLVAMVSSVVALFPQIMQLFNG